MPLTAFSRSFARTSPLLIGALFSAVATAGVISPDTAQVSPAITTVNNPANYVQTAPSAFDAVARLVISKSTGTYGCSGSLLSGGAFVLTAAHCLTGSSGQVDVNSATVSFTSGETFSGARYYVAPGWNGSVANGSDIALIQLATVAAITGFDYWATDSWLTGGEQFTIAGYGLGGYGSLGSNSSSYPFGTLRAGSNTYDGVLWDMPGNAYAWDFDDGTSSHDALGIVAGVHHTGLGETEAMIAPGDSGGPTIYNGRLLGVHSFLASFGKSSGDIDTLTNSSFGELAGDTRTAAYALWIDSVTDPVPEPQTFALLACGLAMLSAARWRRRRPAPQPARASSATSPV